MISELLFRVGPECPAETLRDGWPVAGDVHIEILAVDAAKEPRYVGTLHLTRDVASVLRGSLDRLVPRVWPGLTLLWAGAPLESVAPWSGLDALLKLAKKLRLLP